MARWMLVVGALALVGCNKNAGDSGKTAEIPPDCDDYMTALADCYAEGGFELADGGIDPEAWCLADEEAGVTTEEYACYISLIDEGDCSTAEGIATMSDSLDACEPE